MFAPAACSTNRRARPASRIVFYCAFGERSAMAVPAAQEAGLASARHIQGGMDAWNRAGRAVNTSTLILRDASLRDAFRKRFFAFSAFGRFAARMER